MRRYRPFILVLCAIGVAHHALAMDADRAFMTGGGVGSMGCPEFLNAMTTARQKGGLETVPGAREINPFAQYVLGFQTGFNSEAMGIYDIFASLGTNPGIKALYAIEPWCAQNPDKLFVDGLLNLKQTLRNNTAEN